MSPFFDTNIFVYSVSHAVDDAAKRIIATQLIARGEFSISIQVIQEFINTCLAKARLGQSPAAITETAKFLFHFPCATPSQAQVLHALALQQRFHISYWDAAILAAAMQLGCDTLYTEDLNHGQNYEGLIVINPFQQSSQGESLTAS